MTHLAWPGKADPVTGIGRIRKEKGEGAGHSRPGDNEELASRHGQCYAPIPRDNFLFLCIPSLA